MTLRSAALRRSIFALLIVDTAVFVATGTASEALDALAWLTLLALFMLETAGVLRASGPALRVVRGVRAVAAAAVLVAAARYVAESAWLDAVNAWLWIAVVMLLEVQLRLRGEHGRKLRMLEAGAALLYASLGFLVLVWAWRGEWFDAYDAALWLIAFVAIELEVLQPLRRSPQ